jgi:hypothetical protein
MHLRNLGIWMVTLALGAGCSSSSNGLTAGASGGAPGIGGSGAAAAAGIGGQGLEGVAPSVVTSACGGAGCICSNGVDDDGDGLVDGFDPECTGPLDDDEGSFATGIPGDNVDPKWQDCFFDGNSGGGDDGCRYSTDCLTGAKPLTDKACTVTQQCRDFCQPRTSNGCDCFGCCTVRTAGGDVDIQIGEKCSIEKIGDESACPRCIKTTTCGNECGACELCAGKTAADLPASCTPTTPPDGAPPPPSYTCDGGQVCGPSTPCPVSPQSYCQQGCCVPIIR